MAMGMGMDTGTATATATATLVLSTGIQCVAAVALVALVALGRGSSFARVQSKLAQAGTIRKPDTRIRTPQSYSGLGPVCCVLLAVRYRSRE
jgi:hypothetical protein